MKGSTRMPKQWLVEANFEKIVPIPEHKNIQWSITGKSFENTEC